MRIFKEDYSKEHVIIFNQSTLANILANKFDRHDIRHSSMSSACLQVRHIFQAIDGWFRNNTSSKNLVHE
jgi:hypothetical protein